MRQEKKIKTYEKVWKVIRALGRYTLLDVEILSNINYMTLKYYHNALIDAGYVRVFGVRHESGKKGRPAIVYQLVKNTGPKAPRPRIYISLYDPNINKEVGKNVDRNT